MSENDPDWSVFWERGASATSPPDSGNLWVGKMVGEDSDTDRANEVLGVVVIEEGAGSLEGAAYRAKLGADTVRGMDNSPPYVYDFSPAFSSTPEVALVSQAAMDSDEVSVVTTPSRWPTWSLRRPWSTRNPSWPISTPLRSVAPCR